MTRGLHAHLALDPPGRCPMAALSRETRVTHFEAGDPGVAPTQAVFLTPADPDVLPDAVEVVTATDALTVARLPTDAVGGPGDGPACERTPGCCLGRTLRVLPVRPYAVVWRDGRAHLHLAADSSADLTEVVEVARAAGFGVHFEHVSDAGVEAPPPARVVWLDDLTERQLDVLSVALEMGYFERDGASAQAVADRLGIATSTLSGHLRAATVKLLSDLF